MLIISTYNYKLFNIQFPIQPDAATWKQSKNAKARMTSNCIQTKNTNSHIAIAVKLSAIIVHLATGRSIGVGPALK